ncbi:LuxR C-terminal-related transcriptional regulator [Phenylobacterium sp.]|jgi:DNA-binding CsgD family transcriptional regulator|uniref:helix-turn-helix transcriptional regulator n=1 Tax=Phenylobacterium sp. TaxID=1871053 RepID=UPI0037C56BDC
MQAGDDSLLDAIYGAAVDPDLWPDVLARLSDHLGGSGAWLSRLSVADGSGTGVLSRIDPEMAKLYEDYYGGINPFSNATDPEAYMADWRPSILTDAECMPRAQIARTEYFNDFMRPQDIQSFMILRLEAHGLEVSTITVNRAKSTDTFGRADVGRARGVHGHLRRAFRMTRTLANSGLLDDDIEGVAGGGSVFLLDQDGRLRRMTSAAERLLARRGELSVAAGRLIAPNDPGGRLAGLIATAASPDTRLRAGGTLVLNATEARPPLTVHVAPARSDRLAVFRQRPAVLVTVSESGLDTEPRLTARERGVLTWVAEGKSDWEIGMILGLSETTVRFHVDNARRKLGAANRTHAVARFLRG